jgi:hypothetical protein
MRQTRVPRLAFLALLSLLFFAPAARAAPEAGLAWDLLTMGPDTDLFSLWGHTALCVTGGEFEQGHCFDFGVAQEHDPARLSVGTLAGKPLFGILKIPTRVVLASGQFRDVFRQRLDIPPAQSQALLDELEASVRERETYAYQPMYRNCTTEVRDRLDRALGGRLRQGSTEPSGVPLRTLAEAGLTGRVLPLALLALAGGARLDQPSSAWDRMGLPDGLMQAARERLSAAPSRLFSRVDAPPPTSPAAGRIVLLLLATLGCGSAWLFVRRRPARARLVQVGLGVALVLVSLPPLVGAWSTLPCLAGNWLLLALVPTDAVLCLARADWQKRYVWLRLLGLGVLGGGALVGFVSQSPWLGLWLALMPLGLWLWVQRQTARPQPIG